jgi:hypothetical protein
MGASMYKTIFSVAFVAFGLSTVSQASANCGPFGTIPEADFCVACATGQGLKVSNPDHAPRGALLHVWATVARLRSV